MQVAVQQRAVGGRILGQVLGEATGLLHEAVRHGRVHGESRQPDRPAAGAFAESGELLPRRHVQASVQVGDDLAPSLRIDAVELLGSEPLQEQRAASRVRASQVHRPSTVPASEREVLGLGLLVREGDLEHRRAPRGGHGQDQGAEAVHGQPVELQLPLGHQVLGHPRQPMHPVGPVLAPVGHPEHAVGQGEGHSRAAYGRTGSAADAPGEALYEARRAALRKVASSAGPSTMMATALVIARPVSHPPVDVSRV